MAVSDDWTGRNYTMKRWLTVFFVFLFSFRCGWCEDLQRRTFIGIDATRKASATVVQRVQSGGTAEDAGILPGDALVSIGQIAISDPDQVSVAERRYRAGTNIQFTVQRDGQQLEKAALGRGAPYEHSPHAEILYRSVPVEGALYRVIITKPKSTGRHPAVLLISGLGCYSLDGEREDGDGYGRILYGLTRAGYVTMRVEKSGEGDSEGPPCNSPQADLRLAVKRSIAGIQALKTYDFVDGDRIVIFAHSIGPIEGVLVASEVPVKGFIAAETIGRSWFDYQTEIARSQPLLLDEPYDKVELLARTNEICMSKFYIEKLGPEAIRASNRECSPYLPTQGDVPYTYFQQVAAVNLSEAWKRVDIPVLVIYGTSDPTTSKGESQYLVDMINSFHPARATYLQIEGMSHHFDRQPTQADALRALRSAKDGEFDPTVLTQIENWISYLIHT
jgi:pimeloyl-ACP methyl ester carboxylesterase